MTLIDFELITGVSIGIELFGGDEVDDASWGVIIDLFAIRIILTHYND